MFRDVQQKYTSTENDERLCAIARELYSILVVDDDYDILRLLAEFLRLNGYLVSTASSLIEADRVLSEIEFHCLIIDVMMEDGQEDGLAYLKRKRSSLPMPVMMLTALSEVDDRISGLETGADDYLVKPFDPRELLLRIRNLLRYKISGNSTNSVSQTDRYKARCAAFGDFVFNIETGALVCSGNTVHLTNAEARLLCILAERCAQIVRRDDIIAIWNSNVLSFQSTLEYGPINSRSVDTQIARLRCKIEKNPKYPEFLQAIRGVGYVLWAIVL